MADETDIEDLKRGLAAANAASRDRASVEQALRESELRYRTLFETMGQGYCLLELVRDETGRAVDQLYLELNPAFERLFGIAVREAKGRRASEVFPYVDPAWHRTFDEVARTGTYKRFEHQHGDGNPWFEVFAYPAGGDRVIVLYDEITDRKRAEGMLRESEERQAFLLRFSDALRAQPDVDAMALFALEAVAQKLQLDRCYIAEYHLQEDRGDLPYQVGNDRVPPLPCSFRLSDFPDALEIALGRTLVIENVCETEFLSEADKRNMQALGMGALVSSAVRKGENRPLFGIVAVSADPRSWTLGDIALIEEANERLWSAIERAQAEARLREREEKYRSVFEGIDEGFCIWEVVTDAGQRIVDLKFVEVNPAFERQTGLSNVVGRLVSEVAPGTEAEWIETYGEVARVGTDKRFEMRHADTGRWYDIYATRLHGPCGPRVSIVFRDITDRKRAEEALRENHERQAFLLELSDTIRPLASAEDIQDATTRLLGAHLDVDRAMYGEVHGDRGEETGIIRGQYVRPPAEGTDPVAPFPDHFTFADYGENRMERRYRGDLLIVPDIETDPQADAEERANWGLAGVRAAVVAPLVKGGRLVAELGVHCTGPREWTDGELSLIREVAERTWAAAERARAEIALRESEGRQAFLLKLSDILRELTDPNEIVAAAAETLGRHLGVGRCGFGEVDASDEFFIVDRDWTDGAMPSFKGRHRLVDFGPDFTAAYRAGRAVMIEDALADARAEGAEAAFEAAGGVRASLGVPLMKHGHFVGGIYAQQRTPRQWSAQEESLAREVVERIWDAVERARAEERLRASDERFTQFARASSAGLWIRDAKTLRMEFASPAVFEIYGAGPETLLSGVEKWAALIVPEDRDAALAHIGRAREGESEVQEFRIQRASDKSFRWTRDTSFPLTSGGQVQRIGGIVEDVTERKLLTEHQSVLLAELQHRVRNIMAVIRSIVTRTAGGAESTAEYVEMLSGRLITLARVQALLTRAANAGVPVSAIVDEELGALAAHSGQFEISGPEVELSPKAAETLTLAVHELTTNAIKYGALSAPGGRIAVRWQAEERGGAPWLTFDWAETGAPARAGSAPRRKGFGSELIEGRVPYELGGRGTLSIEAGGAHCHLEFPLADGASILETDAPRRANLFGGAIDMRGRADLTGRKVLVVEDDYYLATDTARALQGAGARVVGPCATEAAARHELAATPVSCAVLDINLGGAPSFDLARVLDADGIPFVFITGYDQEVIPEELQHVVRLQKPVQFREVVSALAERLAAAG